MQQAHADEFVQGFAPQLLPPPVDGPFGAPRFGLGEIARQMQRDADAAGLVAPVPARDVLDLQQMRRAMVPERPDLEGVMAFVHGQPPPAPRAEEPGPWEIRRGMPPH